jgi:hypothetical protein
VPSGRRSLAAIPSVVLAVCLVALAGCGGSSRSSSTEAASALSARAASHSVAPPPADLSAAERPRASQFPPAGGRTLIELARLVNETATLGPANRVFTPGRQRVAFAVLDHSQHEVYAPTAVYLASSPSAPARGPFLAPADPLGVERRYSSGQDPDALKGIYSTDLPLPRSGIFYLLALTRSGGRLIGSTDEVAVALSTPIPSPGQRPPAIRTDTLASVNGKVSLLTTRVPPENMHATSFEQVLGKRPIALLFSTPALCTSRVCGPVTDIMVQLQHQFAGRVAFIHEEVYVGNDPSRGLRPQLLAFHLKTEPWLFTINRRGVIAARLEGAFGMGEARQALEAALR